MVRLVVKKVGLGLRGRHGHEKAWQRGACMVTVMVKIGLGLEFGIGTRGHDSEGHVVEWHGLPRQERNGTTPHEMKVGDVCSPG